MKGGELAGQLLVERESSIRVSRGLDEEQTAVNTGILDVPFPLCSELLSEVGRVLILDVLDDRIPASVVVDLVSVTGGIDNIQAKPNAILLNDY